ncbi:biosynthetic arginine decarboxylase [Umezakia ovalisporum]|jgi:arginine decarboxylase|uniref:Biosynthetic arginine decarboxylase n=2 Tax=Umezakia ovalisporum TaxID=75695 RepID=A0AA43GY18_9CYAN|nr:biosynthetic arginine decarboxylase [Umezakia ovalisporum]MBI1240132.1 biosynthetic arginine decarboxylase [Nostoc sp. RI_552]MDH6056608.1 biosynthetic arginine decarboxylase [Umezakia ovalisporum FSS-43]MDH6063272.1 biosynthetic arginine decarboxylase [Umezakia ovalisporum FSS-62]MDH6066233.1 biosynthetic arginine decarboxylase [Umezakia ovalisporum APH033B]MDH6070483.1 biosynthetic arginine decarboxylase [Umezakia ovalisporum CobakiLakeA]
MGAESIRTSEEVVMSANGHKSEVKSHKQKKLLPPSNTTGGLPRSWKIEDSEALYRIEGWGHPYFSINAAGHITVSPKGDRGGSLDLFELVNALKQRNLGLPMLIRFSDILEDRIERLNACFNKAIARYNYPGVYRGVFPVKCNQERHLIEDLVKFGKPHQFGLEAGSKPELMIALALLDTPGALLICNGYKDREYIETAMLAQRLGQTSIVVIEQVEELDLVIAAHKQLGIKPILGVRAKLSTQGMGRWGTSTGDRAKFGLTIPEIMEAVNKLQAASLLDCLQLMHFHIGSQISAINVIKDAIQEASRIYVELAMLGADMKYLDVGGGLGVDYDGSQTNFYASKNYNMQNYANDIVAELKDTCAERQIPVPTLISESGRAIASHQSVLIFDVLSTSDVPLDLPEPPEEGESPVTKYLWETYQSINQENYQEFFHDAAQFKEEAISRFNLGILRLAERAKAERLYWACCQKILNITRQQEYVPDELEDLEKIMASIYYVNLSVFQSAPDCWAIDQLFPIMPIHRLGEEPIRRGILADLTCDSDGKIDRFIDLRDVKSVLELHTFKPEEPYYLGMFLNGAYQEIMGNLHNLFGDTNAVHIQLTPKGYQIQHVVKGDTMSEVVRYVQYDSEDMVENIRQRCEKALEEKHITLAESQRLLQTYEQSLGRYTYLNS